MQNSRLNEIPIPKELNDAVNKSLDIIEMNYRRSIKKKIIGFSMAATTLAAFFIWGAANPVLAARIPLIGGIFSQIEKDVEFSGDYSDKSIKLEEATDPADNMNEEKNNSESHITADNDSAKITASEVYCDGYSIYLTIAIETREPLGKMPEPWTDENTGETTLTRLMVEGGSYSIDSNGEPLPIMANIEGKRVDDYTFTGMLKLDLMNQNMELTDTFDLNLSLSTISYSDLDLVELHTKNISENVTWDENDMPVYGENFQSIDTSRRIEGTWNLAFPVKVDSENVREYKINRTNESGFGIDKIIVTPYEVKVQTIIPKLYATPEEELQAKIQSYEEIRAYDQEFMERQGLTEWEGMTPKMTPEEIDENFGVATLGDYGAAVYSQDGERLQFGYEDITDQGYLITYSVDGKDLSKISVYIGEDAISCFKENNMQAMADRALFEAEVDLTK